MGNPAKNISQLCPATTAAAAKDNLPEHGGVRGTIWHSARSAINLSAVWNERFERVGNGGTVGVVSRRTADGGRKGFAASSADTGDDAVKEAFATFA